MKKIYFYPLIALITISIVSASPGNQGSIWTTNEDCGKEKQNENHYAPGDDVYINGANFKEGLYEWDITGQPGQASGDPNKVVANGIYIVPASGGFCFKAYTVANDDWGEYKTGFGKKNDNYHVKEGISPQKIEVPEFTAISAGIVLLAAGFYSWKKRK